MAVLSTFLFGTKRSVSRDKSMQTPPTSQYTTVKRLVVPYILSAPEKKLPMVSAEMPKCHNINEASEGYCFPYFARSRKGRTPPRSGKAKAYNIL